MTSEGQETFDLDADACELLAVVRDDESLPPAMRDRLWARLEASAADAPSAPQQAGGPRWRRIAVIGLAAAAVVIAFVGLRGVTVDERERDTANEAVHGVADQATGEQAIIPARDRETIEVSAGPPSDAAKAEPATDEAATSEAAAVPELGAHEGPVGSERSPSARQPALERAKAQGRARGDTTPEVAPASTLAQEVALIESIRAALLAEAPARALTRIEAHARRFPEGVLAQEREALRAMALCANGDTKGRARAAAFVRAHADSPLAAKVRAACPAEEKPAAP